jgi:hypothetical protein
LVTGESAAGRGFIVLWGGCSGYVRVRGMVACSSSNARRCVVVAAVRVGTVGRFGSVP